MGNLKGLDNWLDISTRYVNNNISKNVQKSVHAIIFGGLSLSAASQEAFKIRSGEGKATEQTIERTIFQTGQYFIAGSRDQQFGDEQ